MAYHYVDSGLDNVYLENGYVEHATEYGNGVSIQDTEGLHRALGAWLVSLPNTLTGAEFRFLRLEMEMTQRNLARLLAAEEQTVRRWEKARDKPINGPADRLVRALYTEFAGGDGSVREMVNRLAELDEVERVEAHLSDDPRLGWRVAA